MYEQWNSKGDYNQRHEDLYDHLFHTGELFFKVNYLKLTKSRCLNNKKFRILRTCILFPSDNEYRTYLEINNDLQLNINIYNALVAAVHICFDIGAILRSSFISEVHVSPKHLSYYLNLKCILPERLLFNLVIMWH